MVDKAESSNLLLKIAVSAGIVVACLNHLFSFYEIKISVKKKKSSGHQEPEVVEIQSWIKEEDHDKGYFCPTKPSDLRVFKPSRSRVALISSPGSGNSWTRHLLQVATGYQTGGYGDNCEYDQIILALHRFA